jgi:putative endonuclease
MRILEHKQGTITNSFTYKYQVNRLVYYEEYDFINEAIDREKQLKKWRREKKVKLIESVNPGWRDLSNDFID